MGDKLFFRDPRNPSTTYPFLNRMLFDTSLTTAMAIEFVSDGSVVQNGFQIRQVEENCSCSNAELIPNCGSDVADYSISKFCSNVDCIYTFKPNPACPDRIIYLVVDTFLRQGTADTFVVTIGQNKIINPTFLSFDSGPYLPSTTITMRLVSDQARVPVYSTPFITIQFATESSPTITNIELTSDNPVFALDMYRKFGACKISVPAGNTVEISLIYQENSYFPFANYDLYDGPDKISDLSILKPSNASDNKMPTRYTSKRGYLVLYNKLGGIGAAT
uniref:Uncharacterized protein n=1 Tax=Panagrolaimus sp. JU765 TaxID=591449 RepID=A0AC34R1I4_9BILA